MIPPVTRLKPISTIGVPRVGRTLAVVPEASLMRRLFAKLAPNPKIIMASPSSNPTTA